MGCYDVMVIFHGIRWISWDSGFTGFVDTCFMGYVSLI